MTRTLCLGLFLGLPALAEDRTFFHKITANAEQSLAYQIWMAPGLFLGTEVRYQIVGEFGQNEDLHADQAADYWILTLTKELSWLGLRFDNTLKYIGDERYFAQAGLDLAVGKEFEIRENLVVLPGIEALAYELNAVPRGWHHQVTGFLGIRFGVEFLF